MYDNTRVITYLKKIKKMPRNPKKVQEDISLSFVSLVAQHEGYKVSRPSSDDGVDLVISRVISRPLPDGRNREFDDGSKLDIQVKSCKESKIVIENGSIKYDLESKNYNDLVSRKKNALFPLVLFLVIFPDDATSILEMQEDLILLKKYIYWYLPQADELSGNQATVRITIPHYQKISNSDIKSIYENYN